MLVSWKWVCGLTHHLILMSWIAGKNHFKEKEEDCEGDHWEREVISTTFAVAHPSIIPLHSFIFTVYFCVSWSLVDISDFVLSELLIKALGAWLLSSPTLKVTWLLISLSFIELSCYKYILPCYFIPSNQMFYSKLFLWIIDFWW